jgi:U4/U6.U5 tri-snRNP-associated protein 1
MAEEIALSVAETNKLRADLGLAPLRGVGEKTTTPSSNSTLVSGTSNNKEHLELSVEETNKLRAELGLKPLTSKTEAVHAPAENVGEKKELEERLAREKLKRQVQQGIASTFGDATLGEKNEGTAMSWAEKMRSTEKKVTATDQSKEGTTTKKKKKKKLKNKGATQNYDEEDLEGLNVGHAVSEFEAGSTTILTLADAPLLQTAENSKVVGLNDDDNPARLENAQLADDQAQKDRLRQKRQVEMGMGHAGGYAGYDDDEFEELGGVQGPTRLARGHAEGVDEKPKKRRGFQLGGAATQDDQDDDAPNDLFAHQRGKAISLEQSTADVTASDFMTAEEDAAMNPKKKKKETKFKKKKEKKDKKSKRKTEVEDDEEVEEQPKGSILDDLEQMAVVIAKKRKRRQDDDGEENTEPSGTTDANDAAKRRARFDTIMEKGNEQTAAVFKPQVKEIHDAPTFDDEEPDDNFLNEALAKARRLRKLRDMSAPKGADVVALAVLEAKKNRKTADESTSSGGISFAVDETREFTRALRARENQEERQRAKKQTKMEQTQVVKEEHQTKEPKDDVPMEDVDDNAKTEDMAELAKHIEEDEEDEIATGISGTADTAPIGRGMAGVLSMLRHTGEISGRNAGREEMRGRAKDERTYEDYTPLNLNEVVRIGQHATDKDREMASREIKLDYRDEHGRLLTRKEAYRNLCYQFHGHGSSAKNEERRLRQVEREQAEARIASRQAAGAGSLGALKATQKATGKAFVVHKT